MRNASVICVPKRRKETYKMVSRSMTKFLEARHCSAKTKNPLLQNLQKRLRRRLAPVGMSKKVRKEGFVR